MLSPMAEHIQTTRMRRLPTVFGVFTTFSDEILDVKRFAQVNWWKSLTLEGKCLRWRAKPAHLEGHLPALAELPFCLCDIVFDPQGDAGQGNRQGRPISINLTKCG
jgi:hypothetical protein